MRALLIPGVYRLAVAPQAEEPLSTVIIRGPPAFRSRSIYAKESEAREDMIGGRIEATKA